MKVLCQREIDFLALNIIKMRLNECFEKINWGKLHRFRIESNRLWNNYDLNNYSTKNAGPELNSRACDETQASYLRKERTYSLQRSHRLHPPAGARAPGAAPGQRHLPRRNHLHPPPPPEGALLSPHTPLVFTTPTWHFPNPLPAGISSHWGDRHTHTLLEAPASPPASCTGGECPTHYPAEMHQPGVPMARAAAEGTCAEVGVEPSCTSALRYPAKTARSAAEPWKPTASPVTLGARRWRHETPRGPPSALRVRPNPARRLEPGLRMRGPSGQTPGRFTDALPSCLCFWQSLVFKEVITVLWEQRLLQIRRHCLTGACSRRLSPGFPQ